MKKLVCVIAIIVGILFFVENALKIGGANSYANGSANALKKLESAVSNVRLFRQKNGRYPTNWEINCTNYKVIETEKDICIQTVFLTASEGDDHFIVTYQSLGMPFSAKIGAGLKREYTYNSDTKSFNYAHLDTHAEVLLWRLSKVLIGLLLIILPIVYLRSSVPKIKA